MSAFIALYGLTMIVCAALGGLLARVKNRDVSAWIAWGFICPPALIVLVLLPKYQGRRPRRMTLDEEDAMY